MEMAMETSRTMANNNSNKVDIIIYFSTDVIKREKKALISMKIKSND